MVVGSHCENIKIFLFNISIVVINDILCFLNGIYKERQK